MCHIYFSDEWMLSLKEVQMPLQNFTQKSVIVYFSFNIVSCKKS